ncbi:MAG: hypothetical protein H2073_18950 [Pseudomonas sp.]|uniref:hypothetical protein n=1 Tax=Stutzerimonas frequens TaxID=2968969 RepID=UPI0007B99534|nr:hypothetical protein [Stutzerimonas frequens]KZX52023.1 hypothetical protein A3710_08440 [Stutzerimonas frequens]MBA4728072.1 hypothetical protein [Pseudomonas sp.]MBK3917419.1 hypothetical protein [Stutzerimonas frequens]NCT80877.1 hypothetical protein [Stutzerimonas stutzeri]
MSGRNPRTLAWSAFALGVLGVGVGLLWAPRDTLAACVASVLGLAGLPLGGLALGLALAPVSGSARDQLWPWALVASRAMPALVLMVLPGLLGAGVIYEWMHQYSNGFRALWLWWPSFVMRGLLYVALWWALARWLLPTTLRNPAGAGLGLIAVVLSVSLAAMDWALSMAPHFASSIFGLLWLGRLLLSGIAACILLCLMAGASRPGVLRGLLCAATLAWIYLHFMQYLIVWYGNLPEEVHWYEARGREWPLLTWLVSLQSLVFFATWWPFSGRHRPLAVLAAATLLLGLAEGAWLSLASLTGLNALWVGLAMAAAVAAGAGAMALQVLPRRCA